MLLYNQEITEDIKNFIEGMSGGPVVKNLPASAGDLGLIPGLGGFHMLQGNTPQLRSSHALGSSKI